MVVFYCVCTLQLGKSQFCATWVSFSKFSHQRIETLFKCWNAVWLKHESNNHAGFNRTLTSMPAAVIPLMFTDWFLGSTFIIMYKDFSSWISNSHSQFCLQIYILDDVIKLLLVWQLAISLDVAQWWFPLLQFVFLLVAMMTVFLIKSKL